MWGVNFQKLALGRPLKVALDFTILGCINEASILEPLVINISLMDTPTKNQSQMAQDLPSCGPFSLRIYTLG